MLQIIARQRDSARSVVVGLDRFTIFIDGAVALSGGVEDFSQLQIAPNLNPFGNAVAAQRGSKRILRGLIISLAKINFSQSIAGQ